MDQPTETPTPFTDLLRLWRQGWLLHGATLREAGLRDAWPNAEAARRARRPTIVPCCADAAACC
jgi:hypothetical protein